MVKAITNGKVITVTGPIFEKGTVLVEKDKIIDVGSDISIPEGSEIIDVKGKWITPGFIDCHTHLSTFEAFCTNPGVKDGNESSDPITPHIRAIDALNPFDEAIVMARNAGFTTCYTGPGSGNVIAGIGVSIKLRGTTADIMAIPGSEQMKIALGENPKRFYGLKDKMPVTRMGVAALLRETLFKAKIYSDKLSKCKNGDQEMPEFDFKLHSLIKVIKGEQRCRIHCHRSDDIITAIRIAKEFNLDYVIEHATEGYKIANVLHDEGVTCVVGPLLLPYLKREVWGLRQDTPAILERAGVKLCLTADGAVETQWLPMEIGVVIKNGLSEDTAFKSVTINAAEVLKLDDRIGSIEKGKDADIAVFNGHPFHNMTDCILTMIDGEVYNNKL